MNMKTIDTTTGTEKAQGMPAAVRKYEVSEATAALLDCITAVSDVYEQITSALTLRYDVIELDKRTDRYSDAIAKLLDYLHEEVAGQVLDGMIDTKNSHSSNPVI